MDGARLRASFDGGAATSGCEALDYANPLSESPHIAAGVDADDAAIDPLAQLAQRLEAHPSIEDLIALSEEELLQAMSEACISTLLKNRVLQRIAQEKQKANVATHEPEEEDEGVDGERNNANDVENVAVDDPPPRPGVLFIMHWSVLFTLEVVALTFLGMHNSNVANVLDATSSDLRRCVLWGAKATCTADDGWAVDGRCDGTIDVTLYHAFLDTYASVQLPAAEPLMALTTVGGLAVLASSGVCPAALHLGRPAAKDEASAAHGEEVMIWKWQLHDPVTAPELLRQHLRVSLSARLGGRRSDVELRSYADGSGLCAETNEDLRERNVTHFSLVPVNEWGLDAECRYTLMAATKGRRRHIGTTLGNTLDLWEATNRGTSWTWPSTAVPSSWLAYLNPPTSSALNMCASHHSVKGGATMRQALNSFASTTGAQQSTCHIDTARQQCHLGISVTLGPLSMDMSTASVVGSLVFWLMLLHVCLPLIDSFTGFRLSRRLVAACCARGPNAEERVARMVLKIWKGTTYLSWGGVYYGFVVAEDDDAQAFMMHSEFEPEAATFQWNLDRWVPIPPS